MNMLNFLKSKRVLTSLAVSSLLFLTVPIGLPALPLQSKAWEWSDSAPWSKRTVTTSVSYKPMGGESHVDFTNQDSARFYDGLWEKIYIPEKYDTDTYIAPVNIRFSYSYKGEVTAEPGSGAHIYIPRVAMDINSGENDNDLYNGTYTDSPVVNLPVPNPDTDYYWVRFRFAIPSDAGNFWYIVPEFHFTISYDVYYRDGSGGGLPDGWSENTTAPAATLPDDLPTVTTAVNPGDTADEITGLLQFPANLLDGMHYLRDTVAQILGLRYVTFIIVLGLICALVAWFLH